MIEFRAKAKFLRVGSTPSLVQEMRGRHGLTIPSATPLRHARNQSKDIRPSLGNQPFCPPRPPPSASLADLSVGTVLVADTAEAMQRGGQEPRYRLAGGMRWENLSENRVRHRHGTKLGGPASSPATFEYLGICSAYFVSGILGSLKLLGGGLFVL